MQDVHPVGGVGFVGAGSSGGGGRVFGDRRLRPHSHHHHHQAAALKCPRCDSLNTKFCYYNNYNLSQPRHFCKNCRRYWTKGGVLRNVPVGGGCRKAKRSSSSSSSKSKSSLSLSSRKDSNCHSSSTESSTTTITTTTAVAPTTVGSDGHGVIQNFESENYRMDMGLEPLLFPSTEIGGFMNLLSNSTTDPLGLSGCDAATTASFNQFLQNQATVQDWEVRTTGGVHQEDEKMQGLLDGVLDPTVRIDDYRGSNSGLATLDWQPASDHGQGLFDLPSTVDHQAYWSQTTTSHHHMWSDHANNDHTLFLP